MNFARDSTVGQRLLAIVGAADYQPNPGKAPDPEAAKGLQPKGSGLAETDGEAACLAFTLADDTYGYDQRLAGDTGELLPVDETGE